MLELSETNARLSYSHPIGKLDADGDLLVDVGYPVSGVFERMPDWIMYLALLIYLSASAWISVSSSAGIPVTVIG
jgi:hypothetical protein